MLAKGPDTRPDFLRDMANKSLINVLTINSRYVSNVSIGFRVRPVAPHVRYKPYNIPKGKDLPKCKDLTKAKERHRTKSENNDSNESSSIVKAVLEDTVADIEELKEFKKQFDLKRSKSLESLVGESSSDSCLSEKNPEVEIVSNCIKNLTVKE